MLGTYRVWNSVSHHPDVFSAAYSSNTNANPNSDLWVKESRHQTTASGPDLSPTDNAKCKIQQRPWAVELPKTNRAKVDRILNSSLTAVLSSQTLRGQRRVDVKQWQTHFILPQIQNDSLFLQKTTQSWSCWISNVSSLGVWHSYIDAKRGLQIIASCIPSTLFLQQQFSAKSSRDT